MSRRALGAATLLTTLALAGCGGNAPGPGDAQTAAPSEGSTEQTTKRPTKKPTKKPTLAVLQRALVKADTGRFDGTADFGPITIEHSGVYRISDTSGSARTVITAPEAVITLDSVSVADRLYFQIDNGLGFKLERCWATLDVGTLVEATGSPLTEQLTYGVPSEVLAVLDATEKGGATTIDLFNAASAFSGKTPGALGIDVDTTARTPITLTTGDRTVTISFTLGDVIDAAQAAGVDVPAGVESQLGAGRFTGTISKPGVQARFTVPPQDRQVQLDPADAGAFETELAACEAR